LTGKKAIAKNEEAVENLQRRVDEFNEKIKGQQELI
jgi:hypothetical protein